MTHLVVSLFSGYHDVGSRTALLACLPRGNNLWLKKNTLTKSTKAKQKTGALMKPRETCTKCRVLSVDLDET